jgi:hypothetical protein
MYAFRFAARNPVGTGDWAADMTHWMPEEGPPFRPVIEFAPISDSDFTQGPYPDRYELRWQVPPANGRPIDSFELTYYRVRESRELEKVNGELTQYPTNRP